MPGMFLPIALTAAALGSRFLGRRNKGRGGFEFQPYSGRRPDEIDTDTTKFLRPTQTAIQDIVGQRARGIGVGYDPERRASQEALLRSQLGRREDDEVRAAQGMASASGIGGNLAAQGALEGRVRRDIGRTYGEGLANISIEDLARANQERDINTERLRSLNEFNFQQGNRIADFDLRKYLAEQGVQSDAGTQRLQSEQLGLEDQAGYGQLAGTVIGSLADRRPMITSDAIRQSGTGVAPPQPWNPSSPGIGDWQSAVSRALRKKNRGLGYAPRGGL